MMVPFARGTPTIKQGSFDTRGVGPTMLPPWGSRASLEGACIPGDVRSKEPNRAVPLKGRTSWLGKTAISRS